MPLPWERLLWSCRVLLRPGARYALTDFRLVRVDGRRSAEIAIQDVGEVQRTRSWLDRLLGASTIVVHSRDPRQPSIALRHIRRGVQLAALLDLLAGTPQASLDAHAVRAALSWEPRRINHGYPEAVAGLAVFVIAIIAAVAGLNTTSASIAYPQDDPIYPGGQKRDRDAIVSFMETTVLPWAREALGPIKGGRDKVACETCHGIDPEARGWRMPAVAALPEPHVKLLGWEIYSAGMDSQTRNAIYGYLADSDNHVKAKYMREVVMPGMARLLHRPPYDFTRTYDYNRTRRGFGCYHCHLVK